MLDGTAREKWQQHVATALTDWRMFAIGPRPNIRYEEQLIRSGISEILAIRLEEAYAPIFRTLQRIEGKVGALANLRAEPWAGPNHDVNRKNSVLALPLENEKCICWMT